MGSSCAVCVIRRTFYRLDICLCLPDIEKLSTGIAFYDYGVHIAPGGITFPRAERPPCRGVFLLFGVLSSPALDRAKTQMVSYGFHCQSVRRILYLFQCSTVRRAL